jgi:YaiO family outer membrane protein
LKNRLIATRAVACCLALMTWVAVPCAVRAEATPPRLIPEAISDATPDPTKAALTLAQQGAHSEALSRLQAIRTADPANRRAQLGEVRVLSWMQRFDAAQQALDAYRARYPQDADAAIQQAYLYYYQGEHLKAQRVLQQDIPPGYLASEPAFLDLQRRVNQAVTNGTRWLLTLQGGQDYSDISTGSIPSWRKWYTGMTITQDAWPVTVDLLAENEERFNTHDSFYMLGLSRKYRNGWAGYIRGGLSPEAHFRPKTSGLAGLSRRLATGNNSDVLPGDLVGGLDYRHDDYRQGRTDTLSPFLSQNIGPDWTLTLTALSVRDETAQWVYGSSARVNWQAHPRLGLRLGAASAPETESGVTSRTQTVFGGITWAAIDIVSIYVDASYNDRQDSYIRNSVHAGIRLNF